MKKVRVYGSGTCHDEGGDFHLEEREIPAWVKAARKICRGCHDDFYNYRANCTGDAWCFSLQKSFGKRKTRPRCYH